MSQTTLKYAEMIDVLPKEEADSVRILIKV
jgi:hypothetical protein